MSERSETGLDPRNLHGEDRQRLRQMMQSREFRFLLEHIAVRLLEHDMVQLRNPNIPYKRHLFTQGANYRMQEFLNFCCQVADIPPLFTARQATQLDLSRLFANPEPGPEQTPPDAGGAGTYGSGRTSFPA